MRMLMAEFSRIIEYNYKRKDYGTLGSLVSDIYQFLQNHKNMEIPCPYINKEVVKAKDYFKEYFGRFVVKNEMLPYDIDIKGAYINKRGRNANKPILELSEIDFSKLGNILENEPKELIKLKGRAIYSADKEKLVQTITSNKFRKGKYVRRSTVILVPHFNCSEYNIDLAIRSVDSIYDNNTFKISRKLRKQIDQILQKQVNEAGEDLKDIDNLIYTVVKKTLISRIKNEVQGITSWKDAEKIYERLIRK